MTLPELIKDILYNAAYNKFPKPYKNVYFIKVINPGDKINLFVSFRYKTKHSQVFICTLDINISKVERNVILNITHLKVIERVSKTLFRKSLTIGNKGVLDIVNNTALPIFIEKLNKLEENIYGE